MSLQYNQSILHIMMHYQEKNKPLLIASLSKTTSSHQGGKLNIVVKVKGSEFESCWTQKECSVG